MNTFRRNLTSWLLLAAFGGIAGSGPGLHLATCRDEHRLTSGCCASHGERAAEARSGCGHRHTHSHAGHSHAGHSHRHATSTEQTTPERSATPVVGGQWLPAGGSHAHDCLICQFYCQATLQSPAFIASFRPVLASNVGQYANAIAEARDFGSYLARGPPAC